MNINWFNIIIIIAIGSCATQTKDPKKRIGAIFFIIAILFMEYFLQ